jgi:membrane protease YdiL (CAAX protease family)
VLYGWSKYYKQYQSYEVTKQTNHEQLSKLATTTTTTETSSSSNSNSSSSSDTNNDSSTIIEEQLSLVQHIKILSWAIINACCEEITYRGYWRMEIQLLIPTNNEYRNIISNLGQGFIFGIMHYYGIPNGWIGVILTFIYGIVMGYIADLFHGLAVPIIMHSIADYYIFAFIVRQQQPAVSNNDTTVVSKEKNS